LLRRNGPDVKLREPSFFIDIELHFTFGAIGSRWPAARMIFSPSTRIVLPLRRSPGWFRRRYRVEQLSFENVWRIASRASEVQLRSDASSTVATSAHAVTAICDFVIEHISGLLTD